MAHMHDAVHARDLYDNRLDARIPEVVIWSFFEGMAAAACMMAYGKVPNDDDVIDEDSNYNTFEKRPGWGEHGVVNLDIKARNYLLAAPTRGHAPWASLPVLKMADFGDAIDISDEPYKSNALTRVGFGTPGFMAPEQDEEFTNHPHEVRAATTSGKLTPLLPHRRTSVC